MDCKRNEQYFSKEIYVKLGKRMKYKQPSVIDKDKTINELKEKSPNFRNFLRDQENPSFGNEMLRKKYPKYFEKYKVCYCYCT